MKQVVRGAVRGEVQSGRADGSVRTVFVFLDLPRHVEYRVMDMPLMDEGAIIEFDTSLRDPRDPKRVRTVSGPYRIQRRVLRYSTSRPGMMGLTQFLELDPVKC